MIVAWLPVKAFGRFGISTATSEPSLTQVGVIKGKLFDRPGAKQRSVEIEEPPGNYL